MRCLEICFLTFFLLTCWGRPHREDPILKYKQELVLRAEQLRLLSMKDSCRLGQERRTLVNLQLHPRELYPKREYQFRTVDKSVECLSEDGPEYCSIKKQNRGESRATITDASATLEATKDWKMIHNNKYRHLSKRSSQQFPRRSTKNVQEYFAPLKRNRRYPRDTELSNMQRILPNYSVQYPLQKNSPVEGSIYFSGAHNRLVLNPEAEQKIPRETFTVELWVKPEGGQNGPAVIAGMFDNCSHVSSDRGWSIGILPAVADAKRDARFYFSLRTDRSQRATVLMSPHRYKPCTWTHLAAIYDGQQILLYIDGAQVSSAKGQLGPLHSPFISLCRSLMLGGDNSETGNYYRGHLFSLRLWSEVRTQHQLRSEALRRTSQTLPLIQSHSILSSHIWSVYKDGVHPEVIPGVMPEKETISTISLPPCGRTICDLPDVITGYSRPGVKWEKVVHYRVVNVCEDDGSRPLVSTDQIQRQHEALSNAYSPHGIHWQLNVVEIHNSSLRNRVVLPGCEPGRVGNDHCDSECKHPLTGYDGGDCGFFRPCSSSKKGDGVCHLECNTARDDYDDGDCCPSKESGYSTKTCFDPDARGRAYMSVKELRDALQLNSTLFLNIFFAGSAGEELAGVATWPWDKDALGVQGGIVLNPLYYGMPGHTNTMIHEVGHALGLYHVFKGVSERESCDDPCSETEPSMVTGDLCADTAPTPKNNFCRDPDPTNDTCGPMSYTGTPYNNYMSYTDDDCANSFTPNQVARMRCYLDLKYQGWTRSPKPSPVPLAPKVIKQGQDFLTIQWIPPISGELYERDSGSICESCTVDGSFLQYAHHAISPRTCDNSGYWTPEEAVGPPDVDQPCQPSLQAWSPEIHLLTNMSVPCTEPHGCMLELHFLKPVRPQALTIWITYLSPNLPNPLSDIELVTEHNESLHLGSMEAFCDTPLTIRLTTDQKVSIVRVYTFDARMDIDAALLVSMPRDPLCSSCRPVKYKIVRNPPFPRESQVKQIQTQLTFTDREVKLGHKYQYQVHVVGETSMGEPSPALTHIHGAPFCGDGDVNEELGEECDDGALQNGDGCSQKCQLEENYICRGNPSLCYVAYEGDEFLDDGIEMSADCDEVTSQRYSDQWASQAAASHEDPKNCPVSAVIGKPIQKNCLTFGEIPGNKRLSWIPCHVLSGQNVWLKVSFDKPSLADSFLVYLSSDGNLLNTASKATVTAHLTDVTGQNHSLGTHQLSCQDNPVVVRCSKNPMYRVASLTLKFSSPLIGVYGVSLRSPASLSDPNVGSNQQRKRKDCSSCPALHVPHGTTQCSTDLDGETLCSVMCDEGYVLHTVSKTGHTILKDASLKCLAGDWNLSVTCEFLDCGPPPPSLVFHASFFCPDGTGLGNRCFFTCLPPGKFQGMSQWVTCMWDGHWSLPEGYCKIECDAPPPIANGRLLTQRCHLGNHDVGSTCRYRCKLGYHVAEVSERRPRRKFLKIHCLQTGLWATGRCIPIMCEPLPLILRGMYNCTRGVEVDSKCTLYCRSYTISTICSKDGTWTEKLSLCKDLTGTCPPPPEVNGIHYVCDHGHAIGANCTAYCNYPPNDPVILPKNMTADSVEHWMNPTKVQDIMCTGTLQWYPDTSTLHCIPSCEPFQADGWCDRLNNRAYCQYDGGDCCASTLSSHKGQVIPFGADCEKDECTCRDPEAEENRFQKTNWPAHPSQEIGEMPPPLT